MTGKKDPRDPYKILSVVKNADESAIKKAYRKLAMQHHPDRNRNKGKPEAERKFKDATWAYGILGNTEKRRQYDRCGSVCLGTGSRPGGRRRGNPFDGVMDMTDLFGGFDGGKKNKPSGNPKPSGSSGGKSKTGTSPGSGGFNMKDMKDMIGDAFGLESVEGLLDRFGGGGGKNKEESARPETLDVKYGLSLTFLEAALGTSKNLKMGDRTIRIPVPEGVRDGSKLRVKGKGKSRNGETGDALVEIRSESHSFFERDGNDIYIDLPISLGEAFLGATIKVPTIRGTAQLTIPKSVSGTEVLNLDGEGIKGGVQYVRLKIVLPGTTDPALEKAVRDWSQKQKFNPRADLKP